MELGFQLSGYRFITVLWDDSGLDEAGVKVGDWMVKIRWYERISPEDNLVFKPERLPVAAVHAQSIIRADVGLRVVACRGRQTGKYELDIASARAIMAGYSSRHRARTSKRAGNKPV